MAFPSTIDPKKLRGLSDKVFGLGKEILGTVIDNDRLQEEGEAQQARATEELKALREQAKAEAHEAKAKLYERKEKASQRAKDGIAS